MVGAIGGVDEGVLIGPGGGARSSMVGSFPILGPQGEGVFTGHGF